MLPMCSVTPVSFGGVLTLSAVSFLQVADGTEAEMSIGIFTEKHRRPKAPEILATVGPALERWNELTDWIVETFPAQHELKFMYGSKYGWARRFEVHGTLLTALYPVRNGFTAQLILNRTALEQASLLRLGKNAQLAMEQAHLYTEGKWLFIPVESNRDMENIKRLLTVKIGSAKLQRRGKLALSAFGA